VSSEPGRSKGASGPIANLDAIEGEGAQKLTSAEDRAAHDIVRSGYDQLRKAVAGNSADPAWLKTFDTSGWPNVQQRTVATSLHEFIEQLFDIHSANQSRSADQPLDPGQTQSKGRSR
jgi:hypothetical protein